MKTQKVILTMSSLLVLVMLCAASVMAQIPSRMHYQGYLTDSQGNPVDGTKTMVFSIYDVQTGGTPLWQETRSVLVTDGRYSKVLGTSTPIELTEAKPYYLGIQVESDPEMTPRETIASSMYSFFSKQVEGITVTDENLVGIGTMHPKRELHIQAYPGHNDVYFGFTNGNGDYCEIGYDGDSNGMEFRTAGYETRMFLGDNNNVGIGTNYPKERLHVMGAIKIGNTSTDNTGTIRFNTTTDDFEGYDGTAWKSLTFAGNDLWSQNENNINYSGGYVGIGTTAPGRILHLQEQDGVNDAYLRLTNGFSKNAEVGYDGDTGGLEVRLQGDTKMFVGDNGNVGIGTKNPTETLSVDGTILAKEVLVTTNSSSWPDFVFTDDYELMPLDGVAQHIEQNGHLPGIPSAQEVAEHGVSVGDMQAKMLQKIEELTLHLIALEQENAHLRNRVSTLETLIEPTQ